MGNSFTIHISGMTCHSCEILLERRLKKMTGIQNVQINHKTGIATITTNSADAVDIDQINAVIRDAGYGLADEDSPMSTDTAKQKWLDIGASLLIIFALYKFLEAFDLVSLAPSTTGALSIGGIFLIGLVAGTSSCLAITGGLLLALAAKNNEIHQAQTRWHKFQPLLQFNFGRLVSYFVLGGLVGVLGQSITLSSQVSGYMSIVVALIMLWLALTILKIIPKGSFPIRPPKKLSHWIHDLSESDHPAAPFMLGAFTFFLPCGFTQSLQLVALASGNFSTGATVMFVFALGTLPSLIGLSAISSAASGKTSRLFLHFSGTLVLVLALFNVQSGLALAGITITGSNNQPTTAVPSIINNAQEVSMKVLSNRYDPANITITAGIPVKWKIDGSQAFGCTSMITIPSLNISQSLSRGENVITFTAPERGTLPFMCSMGMVRGSFTVL